MRSYSQFSDVAVSPWSLLFLSGVFFALSQLTPWTWAGVFLGFPLFILGTWKLPDWKTVIWGGLLIGTLKAMGGFAWIWHAYPLVWLDIDSGPLQFLLISIYWVTTSLFMGAGIVLPTLAAYHLRSRVWLMAAIFPAAWLIGEVLGSLSASLWLLGPGSYLNIYIGHGYAGLPLAQFPIFYPVMVIAGLYGLTYAAALLGVLIAVHDRFALMTAALLLFLLLILSAHENEKKTLGLKVIAIDTAFTAASQKTDSGQVLKQKEVTAAIAAAASSDPDIILLPEDSRVSRWYDESDVARQQLRRLLPNYTGLVVDTARIEMGDRAVLRAFYHDLGADRTYTTDKQFLVPQGEYVTYPFHLLMRLLRQDGLIAAADRNQNYVPGPETGYEDFPADFPPMIFCFESSSVLGVWKVIDQHKVPLVLHPISHSWFNDPHILRYHLSLMLKTQAIWGGVVIVTAGNMADSRAYYPDGSIERGKEVLNTELWRGVEYNF